MIDWYAKVQQLKASADELELWAAKSEGHVRLVMGRTADELRQLAHAIEFELKEPPEPAVIEPQPDWLAEGALPPEDWVQSDEPADDHSGEWPVIE